MIIAKLDVAEHILADTAFHGYRTSVFILDASLASITSDTRKFLS